MYPSIEKARYNFQFEQLGMERVRRRSKMHLSHQILSNDEPPEEKPKKGITRMIMS
jgi:hypothetical protein